MSRSEIQEYIWDLRNAQANASTSEERAAIQREIEQLQRQMNTASK